MASVCSNPKGVLHTSILSTHSFVRITPLSPTTTTTIHSMCSVASLCSLHFLYIPSISPFALSLLITLFVLSPFSLAVELHCQHVSHNVVPLSFILLQTNRFRLVVSFSLIVTVAASFIWWCPSLSLTILTYFSLFFVSVTFFDRFVCFFANIFQQINQCRICVAHFANQQPLVPFNQMSTYCANQCLI